MKYCFSFLIIMLACCKLSYSQTDTVRLRKTDEERKRIIITDRPPQAWYFNVGGPGLFFSANYDRRFGKRLDGPGFTGGLGLFFGGGLTVVTLPASLNYLIGKRNNFFEAAAGTTFVTGSFDFDDLGDGTGSGFIWHVSAGFRYQPAAGGFLFRAGFCPLFAGGGSLMFYYIGGGISF